MELPEAEEPIVFTGRAQLSRNGRYAVQFGSTAQVRESNRIDLVSGERAEIPPGLVVASARQAITSDGSIVVLGSLGLALWSEDGMTPIPTASRTPSSAIINDGGAWLIYELDASDRQLQQLYSLNLASGEATLLAEQALESFQPSITNDGALVLYRASPADSAATQVFLVSPDGTERRQITSVQEGVSEAIVSGSGNVAFAATHAGRLLRIDIAMRTTEELVPRSPYITAVHGGAAPGSLSFIEGSGLSETIAVADLPLPRSLGGVEVRLDETPVGVLLVSPMDVRFQIPFEADLGDLLLEISSPESPFEQAPFLLPVGAQMPRFIRSGVEVLIPGVANFQEVIVNRDFTSLITAANPARTGDIVHLYMTGLGVVEPPVATNALTPLEPLSIPVAPFECAWFRDGEQRPIETLFAGLAPALIGVYQISFRLPADPPPLFSDPSLASVTVECGVLGSRTDFASVPVRLSD